MKIYELVKVPDLFTIGNLAMGFLTILFAIQQLYVNAAILLLIAVFCDFLDGRVARYTKRVGVFGKELDSLADLVSFGVAPAVIGYMLGLRSVFGIIILTLFVVSGMLRLARFNVTQVKGFEGVPITTNGIITPFMVILSLILIPIPTAVWMLMFGLMAILMVSTIPITKL